MRIAHLANFYSPTSGGLRTAMHALGAGYREHGHEVMLVVPGRSNDAFDTPSGLRVLVHSPSIPRSGGYRAIVRMGHVRHILERFSPDVVEVSDRTTLRGVGRWCRQHEVPSTFFAHERADGALTAHLPGWLAPTERAASIADWHNRGTAERFDTIVCTTGYAAAEFDRIGTPTRRVPLGVDLDRFHPRWRDGEIRDEFASPDEALVVMASRLSAEKRPDLALDAIRLLHDSGRRVRLVSAGTGSEAAAMQARARDLPVTFAGFISGRERFARLLASADAVVAPGPIETFGLAALEALASGTPVVVNAESALPEVVADAGYAAPSTPQGFADGLTHVLDAPREATRDAARSRAEEFPWSRSVETMLGLHAHSLKAVAA